MEYIKDGNKIMGMEESLYNNLASKHSRAKIILWVITGIIFNIVQGNLISISTLLLIIPGIFVISLASMLTFFIEIKKQKILSNTNNNFFIWGFATFWMLLDLIFPIALSIGYIFLIEYLLKLI